MSSSPQFRRRSRPRNHHPLCTAGDFRGRGPSAEPRDIQHWTERATAPDRKRRGRLHLWTHKGFALPNALKSGEREAYSGILIALNRSPPLRLRSRPKEPFIHYALQVEVPPHWAHIQGLDDELRRWLRFRDMDANLTGFDERTVAVLVRCSGPVAGTRACGPLCSC